LRCFIVRIWSVVFVDIRGLHAAHVAADVPQGRLAGEYLQDGRLDGLKVLTRIDTPRQERAYLVATIPRVLQANIRIDTQRQLFSLAAEAVLEPPPLTPLGFTRTNSPFPSASLCGFALGLALRIAVCHRLGRVGWRIRFISN
jgi:hypothetical protein